MSLPTILDERLYNDVHKILEKNAARKDQIAKTTKNFYLLRDFMICDHCGTNMAGRIIKSRWEQNYYCLSKNYSWKKGNVKVSNKYKRGRVDGHGCDLKRSLSIPLTDKFVWEKVLDVIAKSNLLKEEVKRKVLDTKTATSTETNQIIKKEQSKRSRLLKQVEHIQTSIAEMETKYLLKKYDDEIYQKIEQNLSAELNKLNDEIEQSRIKIKEFGSQKKWLDWLSAYNEKIDEYENYSDEQKKKFLEGIIDQILVRYDEKENTHYLKISFIMPLVDDGIKYKTKNKSEGYELIKGSKHTAIGYQPTPRGKKSPHSTNYSTVTDFARFLG